MGLLKTSSGIFNNQKYTKAIVDGIRNPAEIMELRKLKNFFLIVVDAPSTIRFRRMVEINRESDPKTWEDFLRIDARDKGMNESESGQSVARCMKQADFTLINDKTLEETKEKVEIYCGGYIGVAHPSCVKIGNKAIRLSKEHKAFFEKIRKIKRLFRWH